MAPRTATRTSRRSPAHGRAGGLARRMNHAHAWLYAHSHGRVGGRIAGHRIALLTTVGRRTGRSRRTPVQLHELDGAWYVIAAAGGAPRPPAWWHNLVADPRVTVRVGDDETAAMAVTLPPAERDAAWSALCTQDRRLPRVQERAGHELPVVRLYPGDAPPGGG